MSRSTSQQFLHFLFIYDFILTKPLSYFGVKYALWVKTAWDKNQKKVNTWWLLKADEHFQISCCLHLKIPVLLLKQLHSQFGF